jgi:hypothetical protein
LPSKVDAWQRRRSRTGTALRHVDPGWLAAALCLAGRAEDLLAQIHEIAGTGITQIALFPTPLPGQTIESVLDDFLRTVLPRL